MLRERDVAHKGRRGCASRVVLDHVQHKGRAVCPVLEGFWSERKWQTTTRRASRSNRSNHSNRNRPSNHRDSQGRLIQHTDQRAFGGSGTKDQPHRPRHHRLHLLRIEKTGLEQAIDLPRAAQVLEPVSRSHRKFRTTILPSELLQQPTHASWTRNAPYSRHLPVNVPEPLPPSATEAWTAAFGPTFGRRGLGRRVSLQSRPIA